GLREGRSARRPDGATWAYTAVPRRALGVFAAARLGRRRPTWSGPRQHYASASPCNAVVATSLTERTKREGVSSPGQRTFDHLVERELGRQTWRCHVRARSRRSCSPSRSRSGWARALFSRPKPSRT